MSDEPSQQPQTPPEPAPAESAATPAVPGHDIPAPVPGIENASGYTDAGVPTLDYVRDKIEGRWATSLGATELAEESAAGRDIAEQEAERAKKAKEKLDEIRRSLGG